MAATAHSLATTLLLLLLAGTASAVPTRWHDDGVVTEMATLFSLRSGCGKLSEASAWCRLLHQTFPLDLSSRGRAMLTAWFNHELRTRPPNHDACDTWARAVRRAYKMMQAVDPGSVPVPPAPRDELRSICRAQRPPQPSYIQRDLRNALLEAKNLFAILPLTD